jgi:hypothetical protein
VAAGGTSLADPAVDPLSQQIGMAVVPGILLDHVHQEFPQRATGK